MNGIDFGSFVRGLCAMRWPHEHVIYALRFQRGFRCKLWCELWTPAWHEGRGPHIAIGLGFISIMRGY